MLATQIEVSDGTLSIINVGIKFFEQDDISVSLDQSDLPLVLGVDYVWSAGTTITFLPSANIPGGLVPNGIEVIIRRDTKNDAMYNLLDGGAPFSRLTLDENYKQLLYLTQEFSEGLGLDGLRNNLNMNGYKILNVGNPVTPQDAATKWYVDDISEYTLRLPEKVAPLPSAVTRANKVLGFNGAGQPIATLPVSGSGTELALDLADGVTTGKGDMLVAHNLMALGSVPTTVGAHLLRVADAVLDFGADPTGTTDSTGALLAFFTYCLGTGGAGHIPAGTYLVLPGVLDFTPSVWADRPFPHISTAGYAAVTFKAYADVAAPMLRINNGTAASAQYRLWRGGSLGGITFRDDFAGSGVTTRHGLSIYGFTGTTFGYMRGISSQGDFIHFERKMFGGTNPDPYNVSFCTFLGIESSGAIGYGVNNNNSVGLTHNTFKFIRVVDGVGGVRGLGVTSSYQYISLGNLTGTAFDVIFDTLTGGRTSIEYVEIDNCRTAYDITAISGLEIKYSRIVHRYQTGPNTNPEYWPVVSYNISKTGAVVTSLSIVGFHRTEAGGPLAAVGTFVNFNNSVNVRGVDILLDISDNGGLGILDTQLVVALNRSSLDVAVSNRGKRIASTVSVVGASLRGSVGALIGRTGFAGITAKVILPTTLFDSGGSYNASTGEFKAPYAGVFRFNIQLTTTLPIGTRVRLGLSRVSPAAYLAGAVSYAVTATQQSYYTSGVVTLAAGEAVFVCAEQNSPVDVPLTGSIDANIENTWSIVALH